MHRAASFDWLQLMASGNEGINARMNHQKGQDGSHVSTSSQFDAHVCHCQPQAEQ
jgi:hypothetical protein